MAPLLALLLSCAPDGAVEPLTPAKPAQLTLVDGPAATVEVASVQRVVLRVTDARGGAVEEVAVAWTVTAGGGAVSVTESLSRADGESHTEWTLGTTPGTQVLVGQVPGLPPVTLTTTTTPGVPASLQPHPAGVARIALVGTALSVPAAVSVVDSWNNPVAGATVDFTVVTGGGTLESGWAVTDANGIASAGTWTLGTVAGSQMVNARAGFPGSSVSIIATATAAEPVLLEVAAGQAQSAFAGSTVPVVPTVRLMDRYRNGVPGRPVAFTVTGGGGTVAVSQAVTNPAGHATAGSWQLGSTPGANELIASAGELTVLFSATGERPPGEPAEIQILSGDGQSGVVTSQLPAALRVQVLDALQMPVPNTTVTFAVASGGGTLLGAAATTDAMGIASSGLWRLGETAGPQTVTAAAAGLAPVTFTAVARPGQASSMQIVAGSGQTAPVGQAVAIPPSVRLFDGWGNVVPNHPVEFQVIRGGGSVTGAAQLSDATGVATVGSWTLGSVGGPRNTLRVSTPGAHSVTIDATALLPGSSFDIDIRYLGPPPSAAVQALFEDAVARWRQVIVGDLPPVNVQIGESICGNLAIPPVDETIDDLVIFVAVVPIDGPGGVLGSAGPCYIRQGSNLPIIGSIMLDEADLQHMLDQGTLRPVILHEIGHVLGIGTLWDHVGLLGGTAGTHDRHFRGADAVAAWNSAEGPAAYSGPPVPVHTTDGPGSADGHWRENVLRSELMTPFIGGSNALSAITVGSLADLGYTVNAAVADPYVVPRPGFPWAVGPETLHLHDTLILPVGVITPDGTLVPIRR